MTLLDSPLVQNLVQNDSLPTVPVSLDQQSVHDTLAEVFVMGMVLLLVWFVLRKNL
jgi:hypothetical protein